MMSTKQHRAMRRKAYGGIHSTDGTAKPVTRMFYENPNSWVVGKLVWVTGPGMN